MTAEVIDGKAFAAQLRERVGVQAAKFEQQAGRKAGLAVVLVGEDPASQVYVRSKHKATVAANMESFEHRLPADTSDADLRERVPESLDTVRSREESRCDTATRHEQDHD